MADDTLSPGTLALHRFDGDVLYQLESAEIRVTQYRDVHEVRFAVRAAEGPLPLPPGREDDGVAPHAWVCVLTDRFDPAALAGRRFMVPAGGDERSGPGLSNFCYFEHAPLTDNVLEVRDGDGQTFDVHWTAVTPDVDHADGCKPDLRIEVTARFRLRGVEVVPQAREDSQRDPVIQMLLLRGLAGLLAGSVIAWWTGWVPIWMGAAGGAFAGFAWGQHTWRRWYRHRGYSQSGGDAAPAEDSHDCNSAVDRPSPRNPAAHGRDEPDK